MQLFERPVLVDEVCGEKIEQLGMCRRVGAKSEIAGRADQSRAEVMQPDAIDDHAHGERVIAAGDGPRQLEPAAAFPEGIAVLAGDGRQKLPRHLRARAVRIAADKNVRGVRAGVVLEDHRLGRRARVRRVQFFQLALE